MVVLLVSNQITRVRFPSPAPRKIYTKAACWLHAVSYVCLLKQIITRRIAVLSICTIIRMMTILGRFYPMEYMPKDWFQEPIYTPAHFVNELFGQLHWHPPFSIDTLTNTFVKKEYHIK